MDKRGQIDLSFNMIFSIIIIIAIIGVSFYAIRYFINITSCNKIGLFYESLNEEVEKAYRSIIYQDYFEGKLPTYIDFVCIGNPKLVSSADNEITKYFAGYVDFFIVGVYPIKESCGRAMRFQKLEHAKNEEFQCIKVANGKVKIKIEKDAKEGLVRVTR